MVFLVLFVNLGFWQLRRADEKVRLLAQDAARRSQPPVSLALVPTEPGNADGLPVVLHGRYDETHEFLLDNRVVKGRVGFEVLLPFHDQSTGKAVLVNRGFVPMGRTRAEAPRIPPLVPGSDTATGSVHVISQPEALPATGDVTSLAPGLQIVESASPALAARELGEAVNPYIVRLSQDDPNGLPRYWPVTVMMPSRHRAYAVQWFLMAIAVAIAWSAFSFRRHSAGEDP